MTHPDRSSEMPMRQLGRNGPTVSLHGFGTMTFGAETHEAEAHHMLDHFVDRGGTLIDTADVYSAGGSETIIGNWIRARGGTEDVILATKCRFLPTPGSRGGARRAILKRTEASLKRLGTEAIDLLFIHGWDDETELEETLTALGDLVTAGKVHHIGWSNVTGWQLERICRVAQANSLPLPCAVQPQYSLLERGIEWEVLPCALENGMGLTPWSPLGGGWLTGKYSADARPEGATRLGEDPNRGVEAYDTRNTKRTHAILSAATQVAEQTGRPVHHVALAWLASRPGISSVLLGARNRAQLASNLDALDLTLDAQSLARLTQASDQPIPAYPYGFVRDWSGVSHWDKFQAP